MKPWMLLLAPPLLAYASPWFGGFSFTAHYLLVPLGALLGLRYGASGVAALALGGLPFIVQVSGPFGTFGGNPSLYLIGLAAAAVAASARPLQDWLHWPEQERSAAWLAFAAAFMLVAGLGAGLGAFGGPGVVRTSWWLSLAPLGYFLLFVAGARGVRAWVPAAGLLVATAVTWPLALSGLMHKPQGVVTAALGIVQPVTVLTALAAFATGAMAAAKLRGAALPWIWRRPYVPVTALLVLWFGVEPVSSLRVDVPAVYSVKFLQSAIALPLAAFAAGLLRGNRGALVVTLLSLAVMVVSTGASAVAREVIGANLRMPYFPVEGPFVAAAYGVLGARLAGAKPLDFSVLRYPAYVLLALAVAAEIYGDGGAAKTILAIAFLLACAAAPFAARRLRRAMAGTPYEITPDHWLAFTNILLLAGSILSNLKAVVESVQQFSALLLLATALYDPAARAELRSWFRDDAGWALLAMGAMALVAVYAAVAVLRSLWRAMPKILADLRKILAFARKFRARR